MSAGKRGLWPSGHRRRGLLARSVSDADAFHEFYVLHMERLTVYFTRRVFDAEVSADLAAETFALAFERRGQFRGRSSEEEEGWLFAIARSQLSRYWRQGRVEHTALNRIGVDPPSLSTHDIEIIEYQAGLGELRRIVRETLGSLSSDQAYAVRERVLAERSYNELAHELGVSEEVVRARVSRGLKTMAEALDDLQIKELM